MSASDATDVVVVGLGVHGTAAAYELAARGVRVTGVEQFAEGHARGSSHGRTRMIRRAYPNPVWNDFVDAAFDGWERWQRRSGTTLVRSTGGLYAHPDASPLQGPGTERLTEPDRMRARMPSFAVPAGHMAVHDPAAGVVEAEAALRVARSGARAAGAELAYGERVLDWSEDAAGISVHTDRRTLRADALVLTAGAWVSQVLPSYRDLFEVWRIVTVTLSPGQPVAQPPRLGAFSVDRPEGLVFGVPDIAGSGLKIGVDAGELWDPAEPPVAPTAAEVDATCDLMRRYVPGVATDVAEATACLYTMTVDKRFVIGRVPGVARVSVAAACSGHGFKFAPAVGEALAELATGTDRPDLDFIGTERRTNAASSSRQGEI